MGFCLGRLARADDPNSILSAVGVSEEDDPIPIRHANRNEPILVG